MKALTSDNVDEDSCHVLGCRKPSIRYEGSQNIWTDNLHQNIKLECIGEKYGYRKQEKTNLSWSEKKKIKSLSIGNESNSSSV